MTLRYHRFTAFGRAGPVKKREEEDYRVTDAAFHKIVARYSLSERFFEKSSGSNRNKKIPVKFPKFADLIARDELQWLTTHYPKKAGRSVHLDKQLEHVLSKQKQREQLLSGSAEVHVPTVVPFFGNRDEPRSRADSDNTPLFEAPDACDPATDLWSMEMPLLCDSKDFVPTQPHPDNAPPRGVRSTLTANSPRLRNVMHRVPSQVDDSAAPPQGSNLPRAIIRDLRVRQAMPPHPAALHLR